MASRPPRLIAIVGPTGAGKSDAALALARAVNGEIVACDSLQVYRGLDIGSAKPTRAEQAAVPHHLIDVVDPGEEFSAAAWVELATRALRDIEARGRVALVVGGTGLYLRALLHGLFQGPARDAALRLRLEAMATRFGRARVHRLLRSVDPAAAERIAPADLVRVVRALEVFRATRTKMAAHHAATVPGLVGYEVGLFGVSPPREALRERVERRTRAMLEAGLIDEVRELLARGVPADSRPLQAIGYRQALAVVRGDTDLETARHAIVTETMQYAKRQRTWFRHQAEVTWFADASSARTGAQAWFESGPR
jgi:tRNA dimethylallyltransferase